MTRMLFRKFWPYACIFVCFTAGGFAGCNRSTAKPEATKAQKTGSAVAAPATPATKNTNLEKPEVQIDTSAGPITVRLDGHGAPGTVRNFLNYANDGFYENTLVHY